MKKNILMVIFIYLFSNTLIGQTVVDCKEAGQLKNILKTLKIDIDTLTNIKIRGVVDERDFEALKKVTQLDGIPRNNVLNSIDISEIKEIKLYDDKENNFMAPKRNELPPTAFSYFLKLKSVKFPPFINEISYGCFSASGLEEIVLPETIKKIGRFAFFDCKELKKINMPKDLIYLGVYAFTGCNLKGTIILPKGLKYIEENPFVENDNSLLITIDKGNPYYINDEKGGVYSSNMDTLKIISPSVKGKYVIYPKTKIIGKKAGYSLNLLTGIVFPDSLHNVFSSGAIFSESKNIKYVDMKKTKWTFSQLIFGSSIQSLDTFCISRRPFVTSSLPPKLSDEKSPYHGNMFDSRVSRVVLVVPKDSVEVFRQTYPWSNFKNIVGREEVLTSTPTVLSSAKVETYPNPTSDVIYIRFDGTFANLKIYSLEGKIVYNQSVRSGERINVREWSSGLYYLRFSFDGKDTEVIKLIKK